MIVITAVITMSIICIAESSRPYLNYKSNARAAFIASHHSSSSAFSSSSSSSPFSKIPIGILPNSKFIIYAKDDNERNGSPQTDINEGSNEEIQKEVRLGSGEYYSGFFSDPEEPTERVTGDAVLVPTLKFAGIFAALVGGLLLAFLSSNGLI